MWETGTLEPVSKLTLYVTCATTVVKKIEKQIIWFVAPMSIIHSIWAQLEEDENEQQCIPDMVEEVDEVIVGGPVDWT